MSAWFCSADKRDLLAQGIQLLLKPQRQQIMGKNNNSQCRAGHEVHSQVMEHPVKCQVAMHQHGGVPGTAAPEVP